ncbi:MAG: TRAP transporter small permease subunit, partial [Peptostreptococcaceae bacterium]|nr:TRAP transporter small permease subunit [Peptostreptococcaceae bacterium]
MKNTKTVKTFDAICVSILVVISVLALAQVLFRYVLKISVPWTEEVSRLLYGFLILNGVVLLEAENNQMKTTFLLDRFPKKVRFFVQLFINCASIAFL